MAQGLGSKTRAEPTHGDGWEWKKMGMILIVIYCSYIKQNTTVVTSFPCDSLLNSLSPQIRLSNMLKMIIIMVRHMATQGYNCVFFIRIKSWVCQPQSRDFLILPRTGRCILHDGAAGTTPADVAKLNQGPFNSREGGRYFNLFLMRVTI